MSDEKFLSKIQDYISSTFQKLKIKNNILTFTTSESLLKNFELKKNHVDIIIIDTNLNKTSGINTIYKARKLGVSCPAIYLSDSKNLAFDAIKTNVFRYLLKDNCEQQLTKALLVDYKKNYQPKFVIIKHENKFKKLKISEIAYLEIDNRKSNIAYKDKVLQLSTKMSEIIERLPENIFCRCHFSFCVNVQRVVAIKRYEATLDTGTIIPISKTRYSDLKNMFITNI